MNSIIYSTNKCMEKDNKDSIGLDGAQELLLD